MTVKNMANAIVAYERTLLTPAPFDAYLGGNVDALSLAARRGLETFIKTGCAACHNAVGIGGGMDHKIGEVENEWAATGSRRLDQRRASASKAAARLFVLRVPRVSHLPTATPDLPDGTR